MKLSGIFAAITTPFDHNGDIYRVKIEHNLSRWNATSLAGYVVAAGGPGEGLLLAHDEKIVVWELSAKAASQTNAARTLIADVSVDGVREAAELAAAAAGLGYHAVCASVMHYHAAQSLFFRALADRSPIPVIVGGRALPDVSVAALSQHPNIAGVIKNRAAGIDTLLESVRPDFQVLGGWAPDLWSALKSGAHGAVLSFAAAAPYAAIAVWEAFRTRDEEAGLDWQERISTPGKMLAKYGAAGLKHALDLNGYYGGPPRLPLAPLSAEGRAEIAKSFAGFSGKT